MTKLQSVLGKVWKGALAGGVASVTVALADGVSVASMLELKNLVVLVFTAFLTGAVLGAVKLVTWVE